jgi:hypothetical protein
MRFELIAVIWLLFLFLGRRSRESVTVGGFNGVCCAHDIMASSLVAGPGLAGGAEQHRNYIARHSRIRDPTARHVADRRQLSNDVNSTYTPLLVTALIIVREN